MYKKPAGQRSSMNPEFSPTPIYNVLCTIFYVSCHIHDVATDVCLYDSYSQQHVTN